jgi:uncharacterized protein
MALIQTAVDSDRVSTEVIEKQQLRASMFNAWTRDVDGTLILFNSLSSALLRFSGRTAKAIEEILQGHVHAEGEVADYLLANGVVVPETCDERERARRLHEGAFRRDDSLSLMLLSHENCNFRCTYCYEDFKKKRMKPEVVEGVLALVRARIPKLKYLSIGWFGGEPLLAMDLVEDVATRLRTMCREWGVSFTSEMTTNGYLLDAERGARCIAAGVVRYQVTLDGPARFHDTTRRLANGQSTFDQIIRNLKNLRDNAKGFKIVIRVNFSPLNLAAMPDFVKFLGAEFGNDERFSVRFRPVGRWGGPNDASLTVCDHKSGEVIEYDLMEQALQAGLSMQTLQEGMQRFGSVCYAASPNHFVIGSDGIVYKCTVAFNDPRNHVGKLDSLGNLHIKPELLEEWTRSGEETDSGCQACGFRPACQGNICPLERMDKQPKRCPTLKTQMKRVLPLVARDARRVRVEA